MRVKKVNLIYIILLYLFTGGIYAIYWFVTRGNEIYKQNGFNFKQILPYYILVTALIYVFVPLIAIVLNVQIDEENRKLFRMLFGLAFFALAVIVYISAATISSDVAKYLNAQENIITASTCSPRKAFWLTFVAMISVIYVQYHINKIMKCGPRT